MMRTLQKMRNPLIVRNLQIVPQSADRALAPHREQGGSPPGQKAGGAWGALKKAIAAGESGVLAGGASVRVGGASRRAGTSANWPDMRTASQTDRIGGAAPVPAGVTLSTPNGESGEFFVTREGTTKAMCSMTIHWASALHMAPLEIRYVPPSVTSSYIRRLVIQLPAVVPKDADADTGGGGGGARKKEEEHEGNVRNVSNACNACNACDACNARRPADRL